MANSAAIAGNSTAPLHHPAFHVQGRALIEETTQWVSDNGARILIALGIGAALVLIMLALKRLGRRWYRTDDEPADLRGIIGRMAAKTGYVFIILLAAKLVDNYADTPPLLDKTIGFLFTVAFTFQAALWARELILGFVEYRAGLTNADHSTLGSALSIIRFLVTFTLFSLALILVLDNIGVNVTGLVAGLGVGGIAIGLAAQGIFKDLFAALAIIFDRPFRKGDSIKWNNISGTVERIGLKTTRIRVTTGEQVIVGNANLLEKEMFNLARLDHRRIILTLNLPYDTPQDGIERAPGAIREIIETVPKCKVVRVGVTGLLNTGIQIELQFDVMSANYNDVFDARNKVCLLILRRMSAAGAAFAGTDGKPLPIFVAEHEQPLPDTLPADDEDGTLPGMPLPTGEDGEEGLPRNSREETAP